MTKSVGLTKITFPLVVRNILANYVGRVWAAVSIFLFVPLYIKLLGLESYGVVSFHSIMLGIALIADAGLSAAFAREVARSNNVVYLRDLLFTMERLYLSICAAVAIIFVLLSPWIATRWLQITASVSVGNATASIALMGVAVSLQLAMSLYIGGLMGLQRQESANINQILFSVTRAGLVLVPLYWMPTLTVYFAWQLFAAALFLARFRHLLWKAVHGTADAVFRWSTVAGIYRFALGMLGMSVIGALNTQLDKLVASRLFPLSDYAIYSIAGLLGQAPSMLTLPIALAVLPRMTQIVEGQNKASLSVLYRTYTVAIALVASTVGMLLIAFAQDVVQLWTGNAHIAVQAAPVLRILAAGGIFLALQLMPYHLSLANGHNSTNVKLGFAFLLVTPILTIYLAQAHGMLGAAYPWLLMNLLAAGALGYVLTSKFLPGKFFDWLLYRTLAPTSFVLASTLLCREALAVLLPIVHPAWLPLVIATAVVTICSAAYFAVHMRLSPK